MNPLLRWAGSKRKLLHELRELAPHSYKRYIEPFAGSAVLFFDLLPSKAVLGDLNAEVIATYLSVRDDPLDVARHLYSIPQTRDAYYLMRQLDPTGLSNSQRAARLIFLMKSCFNGVYRTNRSGVFNVPLGNRFFTLPSVSALESASEALQKVELITGDFSASIATASDGDFVYLDPPYSDSTRFRGEYSYQGAFQCADLERLIDTCKIISGKGAKVLLSFKECDSVCDSLPDWKIKRLDVSRSVAGFAGSRRSAREVLVYNY
ncbi:DNA adenine methylase [Paucibacter sp. Y2R2-4]|uniref:DNA adenine methylase n=1 Tax=Paucibacter sp. Y2R2-4 TaxID=2893553 RepID=UPI0021E3F5F5|nr:Dam family site-specific DNA-(adenine-N6)-methyltransferase [Paucibacter sp. Y2R2-4]MCV2349440.1 Dam family site-specific DNA-(adenine-N6)-methyltransferase [Paucibacter sp. Y2R2-4]